MRPRRPHRFGSEPPGQEIERRHLRFRGPFPKRVDAPSLARLFPLLAGGLLLILTAVPWPDREITEPERCLSPADEIELARMHARIAEVAREIKRGGLHWVAGRTAVSHLAPEQFRRLLGARPPADETERFARLAASAASGEIADLPARWDWREAGVLGPARDQGICGSCWAFCAAGAFEALLSIYDAYDLDLSEQHVLDCNEEGYDCDGGWMTAAYRLWQEWGALSEAQLPYAAADTGLCASSGLVPLATLASWQTVSAHRTALQQALLTGPLAVAMHVYDDFQHYQGGIYEHAGSDPVNHAVLLVGWDDEREAWILRNSWGTDWGDDGYAYVRFDCCRLGTYAHRIAIDAAAPLRLAHASLPACLPAGQPIEIRVLAASAAGTLAAAKAELHYDTGEGVLSLPMEPLGGDAFAATFAATLPALSVGAELAYWIEASDDRGHIALSPSAGMTAPFASRAMRVAYQTDFESPGDWSADPASTAAAGFWEWGVPQGTLSALGEPVQPRSDHSADGTRCFATGLTAGASSDDNDIDAGTARLISPALPLAGLAEVTLQFWYWFFNSTGAYAEDAFEVSARTGPDGAWQTLIEMRTGSNGWKHLGLSLEPLGPLTDAVQIRFTACDSLSDSTVEMALDDLQILTATAAAGSDDADDDSEGDPPPLSDRGAIDFRIGPNPTKGPAALAFDLPDAAGVQAAIFDLSGRRLRTLADEWLPRGHHELEWDGRDETGRAVGPGRYWARLMTPAGTRTKSLTVLR